MNFIHFFRKNIYNQDWCSLWYGLCHLLKMLFASIIFVLISWFGLGKIQRFSWRVYWNCFQVVWSFLESFFSGMISTSIIEYFIYFLNSFMFLTLFIWTCGVLKFYPMVVFCLNNCGSWYYKISFLYDQDLLYNPLIY